MITKRETTRREQSRAHVDVAATAHVVCSLPRARQTDLLGLAAVSTVSQQDGAQNVRDLREPDAGGSAGAALRRIRRGVAAQATRPTVYRVEAVDDTVDDGAPNPRSAASMAAAAGALDSSSMWA